jgi:hypothetical protein
LALLLVPAVVLVAQADHTTAFTGTWKTNLAKSTFGEVPPHAVTVTQAPDGTFTVEGLGPNGKPMKWSHAWSGGKEVPIEGLENGTIISKIKGRTQDDTIKVNGKIVQTVHSVLSPDGKTVTATTDITDNQGHHTHHVEVLEKQ